MKLSTWRILRNIHSGRVSKGGKVLVSFITVAKEGKCSLVLGNSNNSDKWTVLDYHSKLSIEDIAEDTKLWQN